MPAKASSPQLPPDDPAASARAAGLRYVTDTTPGITRRMESTGWAFYDPEGRRVDDGDTLARIARLAIPPAWTDVWICPSPRGHLQATGRDARGRKQYRYHTRWRQVRDETKYDRMIAFGEALPAIRARAERDLARAGLPRAKVLATVVQLLEKTLIRVGNGEYARSNGSFGLTTLRDKHVSVNGSSVRFEFRGKSGRTHTIGLRNRKLAAIVKRCRDLPGYELFQYIDENGDRQTIDSADVNEYLREISGQDFTAKDFRTWAGTVLAARALKLIEPPASDTHAKKNLAAAVEAVAGVLGNTRSVCRKCYIHPAILDAYLEGSIVEGLRVRADAAIEPSDDLRPDERAVLEFLRERLKAAA